VKCGIEVDGGALRGRHDGILTICDCRYFLAVQLRERVAVVLVAEPEKD
jgi:hypothetical protein